MLTQGTLTWPAAAADYCHVTFVTDLLLHWPLLALYVCIYAMLYSRGISLKSLQGHGPCPKPAVVVCAVSLRQGCFPSCFPSGQGAVHERSQSDEKVLVLLDHAYPAAGRTFRSVRRAFDAGVVCGVVDGKSGKTVLAPPDEYVLTPR